MNARLGSLFLLVIAAGVACQTMNQQGTGGAPPSASTAAASAPGPVTGAAAPAPAPVPAPSPANGEPSVLKLASGATLKMPAGATAIPDKNDARLPGVVQAAHKYQLGGAKRLLWVNEMDRESLACPAVLDRELERANKAKDDTDPQKLALRKMDAVTTIDVAGQRALYAESKNSAPSPSGATPPKLGVATLIMCREREGGGDYLVMMFASDQAEEPDATKKLLTEIAASYAPPSK